VPDFKFNNLLVLSVTQSQPIFDWSVEQRSVGPGHVIRIADFACMTKFILWES